MTEVTSAKYIEYLRPKTVPDGLIALCTVSKVSEFQVTVQIPGGVTCLVDQHNISQSYSDSQPEPCKLTQIFKKGQQLVCKIIEKRPRKGYQDAHDIIATFDPTAIQEDTLPMTLLAIPQVLLQCAVKSVEDHGYLLDIGFKAINGFLSFDDAGEEKLKKGQIVTCCLKEPVVVKEEIRTVHLSMDEEFMKKSELNQEKVAQHTITEKCILPGSKTFLTVMSIRKDGLIVNVMNEFAGFVTKDHLRELWHSTKNGYKISDKFECTVLYYNELTKTFALSIASKSHRENTLRQLIEKYHIGQFIKKAKVEYLDSTRAVVFRIDDRLKAVANARDALDEDVSIMTKDELHLALDSAYQEASSHRCRIKSINLADLVIVVSLRQDFLDLPFASVDELKPAQFIDVVVKKYVKDGIVVTFGHNLRAIILNLHLNDYLSTKSHKKYPLGKTIKCRVVKVDHDKQPTRIYVTNIEHLMDSNLTVIDSYDREFKGKSTQAIVTKVRQDGLIVELFNNIKGFISRRFLSTTPMKNLPDLFTIGQVISCSVYKVDPAMGRLLLGVVPYKLIMKMKREKKQAKKEGKELKKLSKIDSTIERPEKKTRKPKDKETILKPIEADTNLEPVIKSRRQRSEEARLREEKLRESERQLLDPDRPPQSISDFERLILKNPNSADSWTNYSKFFLDNVETEKARIICRRALRTMNMRLESEKLKVWLFLIRIEAKYGGTEKLKETIEEASQTNDKMKLYNGCVRVLTSCNELDEAERLHELMLKLDRKSPEVWANQIQFVMKYRKDIERARAIYDAASKSLMKSELVLLKSRFAQFEFQFGEVERGKTMFENLLSDNPKRTDLWRVYEGMIKKYGLRQVDSSEMRKQNDDILARIQESIELVCKKVRKNKASPSAKNNESSKKLKTSDS